VNGTGVLFYDNFATFPSTNWVTNGVPVQDLTIGNPPPSAHISQLGGSIGQMTLVPTVNTNGGATVSFDVKLTPGQNGRAYALIQGTSTYNQGLAFVNDNGQIEFDIVIAGADYTATIPFNVDANFHNFAFKVDPSGNAEWIRDGNPEMEQSGFPTNIIMNLKLTGDYPFEGSVGDVWVDNVEITSP